MSRMLRPGFHPARQSRSRMPRSTHSGVSHMQACCSLPALLQYSAQALSTVTMPVASTEEWWKPVARRQPPWTKLACARNTSAPVEISGIREPSRTRSSLNAENSKPASRNSSKLGSSFERSLKTSCRGRDPGCVILGWRICK